MFAPWGRPSPWLPHPPTSGSPARGSQQQAQAHGPSPGREQRRRWAQPSQPCSQPHSKRVLKARWGARAGHGT